MCYFGVYTVKIGRFNKVYSGFRKELLFIFIAGVILFDG